VPTKVLGPERPGSALTGPDRVDTATSSTEHDARSATRPEDVEAFGTLHILLVESIGKKIQVRGHLLNVFSIHVDLRVFAFIPATLAASLAGKLESLQVPYFIHIRSDRGN
jgi:hypothetical protein